MLLLSYVCVCVCLFVFVFVCVAYFPFSLFIFIFFFCCCCVCFSTASQKEISSTFPLEYRLVCKAYEKEKKKEAHSGWATVL